MTASNGSWISIWICSNSNDDSHSCPIVAPKYVTCLYAFQNTEKYFLCCCRRWHCPGKQNFQNTIDIRIQVFVYKFQYLTKMAFGLTWFVGYNSHLAFHYFYFKSKLFMGLQICPISIRNMQFILFFFKFVWIDRPEIDLRFSPNEPLTRLTSALGTGNTI
jgi:hypothetical protein